MSTRRARTAHRRMRSGLTMPSSDKQPLVLVMEDARWADRALAVLAGSLTAVDPERARSIAREDVELATGAEAIALVAQPLRLVDHAWALSPAGAAVHPALALTDSWERASGITYIV